MWVCDEHATGLTFITDVDDSDPFGLVTCRQLLVEDVASVSQWNAFNLAVRLILAET